jgi:hypothetical protein
MARPIKLHVEDAHALLAELDGSEHEGLRDALTVMLMRRVFLDRGARPGMEHLAALASLTCDSVCPPNPRRQEEAQAPRLRVVASTPASD